jgi:hypothetical protein
MFKTLLITIVVLTLGAATLRAQDVTCAETGDKNPKTARIIGIVPGAGHIYACEFLRGLGYYFLTTTMIVAGTVWAGLDCGVSSNTCGRSDPAALALGLGLWGWSIYDAGRAAERTNAKRRRGQLSPILTPVRVRRTGERSERGLRIGVSVKLAETFRSSP